MKFYALTYDFVTGDVSRQRGPAAGRNYLLQWSMEGLPFYQMSPRR
jgi:hypothetical protein